MSEMEFVAALVQALGWPAAAVIIATMFRKQLRGLLAGPLHRMKAGPFELEWDRVLSQTETQLDKPAQPEAINGSHGSLSEELAPVAARAPAAAILEAYAQVERELRRVLVEAGVVGVLPTYGALRLARLGAHHGVTAPETVAAIEGMSVLRNLSAHGPVNEVDEGKAREYLALADAVLFALMRPYDRPEPSNELDP